MPELTHVQTNFTSGELSPRLLGRADLSKYQNGASEIENFLIQEHGGLLRRSGTKYISEVRDSTKMSRLIPFQYSTTQHYQLELADGAIRFYRDNGVLNKTINGITGTVSGANATITIPSSGARPVEGGHQWQVGAKVSVSGFVTHAGYNESDVEIDAVTHNTFTYEPTSTPGGSESPSGGVVVGHYEIDAPWAIADVYKIDYWQSADILWLACPGYRTYMLERLADDEWQLAQMEWAEPGNTHRNADTNLLMTPDATSGSGIEITASAAFFNASHVGNWIRIWHGPGTWGWARITTFTDTTHVDVDERIGADIIGKAFGAALPSRFWRIFEFSSNDGPYDDENTDKQWTLDASGNHEDVGKHTIVATQDTFTANDVGRALRIFNATTNTDWGVFIITKFTDAKNIVAWQINDAGAAVAWAAEYRWRLGAWNDTDGWPERGVFHQHRMYVGRNALKPQSFWASETGNFASFRPFSPATASTIVSSDGMNYALSDNQVNSIQWMRSTNRGIAIGTTGGIFQVAASRPTDPITPDSITVVRQLIYGAQADNFPIQTGAGNILFPQLGGRMVREIVYSFEQDALAARELSILSEHITIGGIVRQTAYQQQPNSIAWFVRNDGQLLSLTYEPSQEVIGWSRHVLGGSLDGESHPAVESISVVHNSPDDELWMIVRRTVNSLTKRFVEYMKPERETDDRLDNAFYIDAGLTLDSSAVINNATSLKPVVVATAAAHGYSDGDVVRIRDVKGMTEINDISFKIAEVTSSNFELATINGLVVTNATQANPGQVTIPAHGLSTGNEIHFHDIGGMTQLNGNGYTVTVVDADNITIGDNTSGYGAYTSGGTGHLATNGSAHTAYVSGGTAAKQIASITGADHLEGETVKILADGAVHPDVTVSSGTITLNSGRDASKIQYGLAYTSKLKLLPTIPAGTGYEPRGRLYLPRAAKVRFNQTVGGEVGIEGDLAPLPFRTNELMGEPPAVFSGVHEVDGVQGEYTLESQLVLQQTAPMPMSVLSATIELSLDES